MIQISLLRRLKFHIGLKSHLFQKSWKVNLIGTSVRLYDDYSKPLIIIVMISPNHLLLVVVSQ